MATDNDPEAIERDFLDSWNVMDDFYEEWANLDPRWEYLRPFSALIRALRQKGYDRKLRAGRSHYTLILSRARWTRGHMLRDDQFIVAIHPYRDGRMAVTCYRNIYITTPQPDLKLERAELTPEVERLLQHLLVLPID